MFDVRILKAHILLFASFSGNEKSFENGDEHLQMDEILFSEPMPKNIFRLSFVVVTIIIVDYSYMYNVYVLCVSVANFIQQQFLAQCPIL